MKHHYGTMAGVDDEEVDRDSSGGDSSEDKKGQLALAGVNTTPSRVTATIGFVVSVMFVGLILLVAVTKGGQDFSSVDKFASTVGEYLTTPFTASDATLKTPVDVDVSLTTTEATYPNFVVIVADDLGWNALSYNDEDISFATPVLAGLASKGIIMGNYYAQEVCSPSRASLLTGRYPLSVGMQYGMVAATAEWGLDLDEITLAEVLSDNGYKTHALGKWHLGYFSPLFLPTARGFDSHIGYVNGENYYWSKRSTDYPEFIDFMEADRDCYKPYNGTDMHDYSTTFYTNHAIQILDDHDTSDPLFMYLAYQAVHDPFVDSGRFRKGMPDSLMDSDVLESIHTNVVGTQRKEYIKSLYQLDKHVGYLYDKIVEKGMEDNTYIIFMSDNGGCFYGGGKNGPLRGSKGSLFEGGIKVDSFIYSPKLKSGGTTYNGLMHVSDWFPTMMALAGITYVPEAENELDGVNQVDGWLGVRTPRDTMLYNYYTALTDYNYNIWSNGTFAVRDERYKLMHTYDDSLYGAWYNPTDIVDTDDELTEDNRCAQQFLSGDFTYWLFDLQEDPYETTNLYDSTDEIYTSAKDKLYTLLPGFEARAKTKISIHWSSRSQRYWQSEGNHVLPWANVETLANKDSKDYPAYCPDYDYEFGENGHAGPTPPPTLPAVSTTDVLNTDLMLPSTSLDTSASSSSLLSPLTTTTTTGVSTTTTTVTAPKTSARGDGKSKSKDSKDSKDGKGKGKGDKKSSGKGGK